MVRKLWLVFVAGVLGGSIWAGPAQARIDPTFGHNGVVVVQPPLPAPWRNQYIRQLAATRSGFSFALFERQHCAGGCFSDNVLFRYLRDGSLDPTFGGSGSYELPQEGEGIPALAVDSRGRPLLAQASEDEVVVRRLTPLGVPDFSFGTDGAVTIACDCEYGETRLVPGPGDSLTVALPRSRFGEVQNSTGRTGTILTLVRLREDGTRDGRFGQGGSARFGLRGFEPFTSSAVSRGGALYLSGVGCCRSSLPGYVIRVSANGRFDGRFAAASQHALANLRRIPALGEEVNAVVLRRSGKIDLLGSAGYERGFILRLKPNGHPYRAFAAKGLRVLPLPVASAALGHDGAVVALSDEGLVGINVLTRIFANGRLDWAFGGPGETIPGTTGEFGLSVVPQTGRKVMVLDLGLVECRGYCGAEPKLMRFLEGSPKRR